MTTSNNNGASERLRQLILKKFGRRRKFLQLENESGISASKWKNFFYQKQDASTAMLQFWADSNREDAQWLLNGFHALDSSNNPFNIEFPTLDQRSSLQTRLKWVISEWCAHAGTKIFKYLETNSAGKIQAAEWLNMTLGQQPPTSEMVEFICNKRPHFSCWVLLGKCVDQVNPTNEESIQNWIKTTK